MLSQEESDLMQAIHVGNVKEATKLITEDRIDVNIQDCLARSPLLRTCYLESRQTRGTLAKLLLKNGADVNMTDKHGRTALMTACMESNADDLVKIFLRVKTINQNAQDENGSTALMHAVRTDNVESVRTLIGGESKSETLLIDLADFEGMYPLLVAAEQQNLDICEILVRDGSAKYSEIPDHLMKYLPPECGSGKLLASDPFENYRHQAQDILNTPFRPPMVLKVNPAPIEELETFKDENEMETDKYKNARDKFIKNTNGDKTEADDEKIENPNEDKKTKTDDVEIGNASTDEKTKTDEKPKYDPNLMMAGVAVATNEKTHNKNTEKASEESGKFEEKPTETGDEIATPVKEKPKEAARSDEKATPLKEKPKTATGNERAKPHKANVWVTAMAVAKIKKKGTWIEESSPRTPKPTKENPFPKIKPKIKTQAYKTKNGRIIHPNTERNKKLLNQIAKPPPKKQPPKMTYTKPPPGATT